MIIPVFRVVTTQFPIATSTTIEPGMVVALQTTTGKAVKCKPDDATMAYPIGLSADKVRASEAFEWVNRLSDQGMESAASGLISVYCGGGEFYVDVDDSAITTPMGTAIKGVVKPSTADFKPGTKLYAIADGQMDADTSSNPLVAVILEAGVDAATLATNGDGMSLDSGIPGEYEPGSSVAYANDAVPRTFVKIKLLI
jgi:hypothetical protein